MAFTSDWSKKSRQLTAIRSEDGLMDINAQQRKQTYHHIKDRPTKSLRHQCAGHPKFSMKSLQSLVSLHMAHVPRRSRPLFSDLTANERLLAV